MAKGQMEPKLLLLLLLLLVRATRAAGVQSVLLALREQSEEAGRQQLVSPLWGWNHHHVAAGSLSVS